MKYYLLQVVIQKHQLYLLLKQSTSIQTEKQIDKIRKENKKSTQTNVDLYFYSNWIF